MTTRFTRGDVVELPKRLTKEGDTTGVVVHSATTIYGESAHVARLVGGRQRHTVVPADELYRLRAVTRQWNTTDEIAPMSTSLFDPEPAA